MIPNSTLAKFVHKNLVYIKEDQRRRTFKKWIYNDSQPCNSGKMAEAGFIFIGDKDAPDAVKCFLCEKTLDGWDPEDNPWTEHKSHSSNCSFAKLNKAEGSLTLQEFLDIKAELTTKTINKYYDEIKEIVEEKLNEIEKQLEKKPTRK